MHLPTPVAHSSVDLWPFNLGVNACRGPAIDDDDDET